MLTIKAILAELVPLNKQVSKVCNTPMIFSFQKLLIQMVSKIRTFLKFKLQKSSIFQNMSSYNKTWLKLNLKNSKLSRNSLVVLSKDVNSEKSLINSVKILVSSSKTTIIYKTRTLSFSNTFKTKLISSNKRFKKKMRRLTNCKITTTFCKKGRKKSMMKLRSLNKNISKCLLKRQTYIYASITSSNTIDLIVSMWNHQSIFCISSITWFVFILHKKQWIMFYSPIHNHHCLTHLWVILHTKTWFIHWMKVLVLLANTE